MARLDYEVHVQWETLDPESDIHAFAVDRLIAVTPLSQDLTSRTDFTVLGRLLVTPEANQLRDKSAQLL